MLAGCCQNRGDEPPSFTPNASGEAAPYATLSPPNPQSAARRTTSAMPKAVSLTPYGRRAGPLHRREEGPAWRNSAINFEGKWRSSRVTSLFKKMVVLQLARATRAAGARMMSTAASGAKPASGAKLDLLRKGELGQGNLCPARPRCSACVRVQGKCRRLMSAICRNCADTAGGSVAPVSRGSRAGQTVDAKVQGEGTRLDRRRG